MQERESLNGLDIASWHHPSVGISKLKNWDEPISRPKVMGRWPKVTKTPICKELPELFGKFIADRQRKSDKKPLRPKTIRSYSQAFDVFRPALLESKYEEELQSAFSRITDGRLESGQMSRSGMNVYIRGFNSFLAWCYKFEFLERSIKIDQLKILEKRKKFPTLSVDEISNWAEFNAKTPVQLRSKHMGLLILDAGMRINECLELRESDIEWTTSRLWIGKGKGGANREVPLSSEGKKQLRRFLAVTSEGRLKNDDGSALIFPTKDGGLVSYRNALRDLKAVAKRLGFPWVGWHSFRRTFGTLYVRNGGLLTDLQQIFGHTDIRTTIAYLGNDIKAIVALHDERSPLASSTRRSRKQR